MSPKAAKLVRQILAGLRPPEDLQLAEWMIKNITLPEGKSVRPGPMENWPYMTEILNAMGDRSVERVTVMKSARLGYTTGLMGVLAATAAMDPGPIILLMPPDDVARGISVDWVEPLFRSNAVLRGLMRFGRLDGRNTLTRKSLAGGGSLKILSARAPRNLSRHDCRLLLCDEVDRYEVTTEGDALDLAERRTMAEPNRKIVIGSTPTDEDISVVAARFCEGSQEIFEIPCVECGTFHAPEWSNLEWENHDPSTVKYMCPHCKAVIDERNKPAMVYAGKWRALKPEVTAHRSFKINALVSLLPNASWATLVKEYYDAKRAGPSRMQVFHNTVLGRPWRTTFNRVDASILADRAEPWGLPTSGHGMIVPEDVVVITCGTDTQDERYGVQGDRRGAGAYRIAAPCEARGCGEVRD